MGPYDCRCNIDGLEFERIRGKEVVGLEEGFSVDEVCFAFLELNKDKVLGSNGFSLAFW